MKQGRSYGGTLPDAEDNAVLLDYYLVSITNLPQLLSTTGVPTLTVVPEIIEYGPIAYRRYKTIDYQCSQWPDVTCGISTDGTIQTGYDRPTIIFDSNRTDVRLRNAGIGQAWDTTYLTIPNIKYRALETNLVALSNGLANSFEDIAIPLFTSNFFRTYVPMFSISLRSLLVPVGLQETINEAVNTVKVVNGYALYQAYDDVALGFLSNRVNMGLLTLGIDLSPNNLFHMSTTVAHYLLNESYTLSPLNLQGWNLWFNTLQEYKEQQINGNSNIGPATQVIMDTFLADFRVIDPLYVDNNDPTQPSTKALYHINLLLSWLVTFVNTTSTINTVTIESKIATALYRIGMIPMNDWKMVVYAQFGSNQVLGSIPDLFKLTNASLTATSRTGLSVSNVCPGTVSPYGGAGFLDIPYTAAQLSANHHVELSCWNNREEIRPNSSYTNTTTITQFSFGTHLSPTDMHKVLHFFTIGTGMLTLYTNDTYFQGTYNIARFLQGTRLLQTDLENHTVIVQHHVYTAATAYANYLDGLWSVNQYTAVMQSLGNCPAVYDPLNLQLPCSALLDLRHWLIYIGKDLVWNPLFVQRGPVVYDNISNTYLPHSEPYFANLVNENNPLRAGPFLKCTVREILEYGCHDNWLDYFHYKVNNKQTGDAQSRVVSIGPMDYSSPNKNSEWTNYKQKNRPNSRYTGKENIEKVDTIQKYNQYSNITLWNGFSDNSESYSNPVEGSYTGTQFAPQLSLSSVNHYTHDEIPSSVKVWLPQGLRSIRLTYTTNGNDPYDNLYTWQYRFVPQKSTVNAWKSIIPRMKTDTVDDTPICAIHVGKLVQNAPVYLSTPYFIGCGSYALPIYETIPGYTYKDNRTRNEELLGTYVNIEPISGTVTNGHQRLGVHLRWSSSIWYPSLSVSYGLVYWMDTHTTIKESDSKQLGTLINDTRNLHHFLIPVILFTCGSFLFLAGIYLVRKGLKIPVSLLFTNPKNVPGRTQPKDDLDYFDDTIHTREV